MKYCSSHNNYHHCHKSIIPGVHLLHSWLHDVSIWYRKWHHYRFRPHIHWLWLIGTLIIAIGLILQALEPSSIPAQGATGILKQFPFQGRLTNADGTVVSNGSYDVVFKLYNVIDEVTADWTESHTGGNQITTSNGIFNTYLGSITSLGSIDFNTDTWYLGITVGADAEMTPRIRLGSAPFAINSEQVGGKQETAFALLAGRSGGQILVGGTATTDDLTLQTTSGIGATGADMHFLVGNNGATEAVTILNGGYVGIGTTSPTYELSFSGQSAQDIWMERHTTANTTGNDFNFQAGGATSGATNKNGGNQFFSGGISTGTGTSNIYFRTATAGVSGTADNSPTTKMTLLGNGNFGVNQTSPLGKIQADGSIYANNTQTDTVFSGTIGADNANFIGSDGYWALRTDTNNDLNIDVYNGGSPIAAMTIEQSGEVGIGTATPGALVEIYKATVPRLQITTNTGQNPELALKSGTATWVITHEDDFHSGNLLFNYGGTSYTSSAMEISTTGNVGIGTTGPTAKLQIANSAVQTNVYSVNTRTTGDAYGADFEATGVNTGNTNYALFLSASGATTNYGLYVNAGNAWFAGDVSALTFTDRTPYYEGDALAEIALIKGKDGKIDHSTLPEFARKVKIKDIYEGDLKIGEEVEEQRDLGAMISIQTVAIQQLIQENNDLKSRLDKLEKK